VQPQTDFDYRGAAEIACRYQQPGHEVPMHLFVTEGSATYLEVDQLSWDEFHKGTLTVHRLPGGDHGSLLDLPQVEPLARMMLESLGKTRASTGVGRLLGTPRNEPSASVVCIQEMPESSRQVPRQTPTMTHAT
jgi:hypothetical protein